MFCVIDGLVLSKKSISGHKNPFQDRFLLRKPFRPVSIIFAETIKSEKTQKKHNFLAFHRSPKNDKNTKKCVFGHFPSFSGKLMKSEFSQFLTFF